MSEEEEPSRKRETGRGELELCSSSVLRVDVDLLLFSG